MQPQLLGPLYQWIPAELRYVPNTAVVDPQGNIISPGKLRPTQAFDYNADFVGVFVLGAGATVTVPVQIQQDSDFLILSATKVATDAAQTTLVPFLPAVVLLTDTGSGRQIMDRPTHVESYFGTGELPRVLDRPYFIRAASTLNVTLQNLDPANARVVRVSFHGAKVF
jgi:hypothetical protein